MKIGILGGTFDPPHIGHLRLAEEAHKRLGLDKVIFVPAFIPPHKGKRKITPPSIRLKMAAALIEGEEDFELSDIEIRRREVSYTVDTLREFRSKYPEGTEFYFITGADSLEILTGWKDWKTLLELCHFVVANRPGFSRQALPAKATALEIEPLDVSSTLVRGCVRKGLAIDTFVPARVKAVIDSERLYRS